eukprot:CAMPEP_0116014634 /NCGR_PEP_ID=MMETSP0321-20121206/6375_1 /TAXON_ID=163516 /ORGANISM="Leptocylindrus danicus var. danicus, Strain B650" /LENGTH=470 /DNA_ID=CAMNT_0003484285 /DNA_START=229 /DNA_END=1641 /DNA_ORIENTATION=-
MCAVLVISAIPTALTGIVNNIEGLIIIRMFIGIAGVNFSACQFWIGKMFVKEISGVANGLAGGFGNAAGGFIQILIGAVLFPLFRDHVYANFENDDAAEKAWRTVCVFPAVVAILAAIWIWFYSEDTPHGDYRTMRNKGWINDEKSAGQNLMAAAKNHNSWIMFLQYATTSGVEVTFLNAASKYFQDEFGQSTETAALIASGVGWVNLFATGIGGYVADLSYQKKGMRGRMLWQFLCIFVQGILTMVFSSINNLGLSIFMLIITAIFVEFSEGSSYGFIPYISSQCEGSVGGIAGAGSLCGAVAFGLLFSQSDDPRWAFLIMGGCISASAFLTPFISIVGESAWFIEPEIGEAKYKARSWNAAITMSSPKIRRQGLVMTKMNGMGSTIRNILGKGTGGMGLDMEDISDSENGDENSTRLSKILEKAAAADNNSHGDNDEASNPHAPFDRRMTDRSSMSTTIQENGVLIVS